ncbi:hypothetical protein [Methylobacterium radiotolerans]|uniref:hypothetical protein n=1 Tax=Methylobacterium radiotolerans TaxID=31998 RepID=UPI0011156549|nr:hypothetical protein [Methylobacterium radiotolerans]
MLFLLFSRLKRLKTQGQAERLIVKLWLAALSYLTLTVLIFGDPLQPIGLATRWADRLGIPFWRVIAVISVVASTLVVMKLPRDMIPAVFRPTAFVVLGVLMPTIIVGLFADGVRHRAVIAFGADEVEERSFFVSIRNAPEDFQFFLHTAAIKECKPYAWSYRKLEFYALPMRAAVNVLPRAWRERCGIRIKNLYN